jgi:hypothetical protein
VRKISPPPGFDPRTVQPVNNGLAHSKISICSDITYLSSSWELLLEGRCEWENNLRTVECGMAAEEKNCGNKGDKSRYWPLEDTIFNT